MSEERNNRLRKAELEFDVARLLSSQVPFEEKLNQALARILEDIGASRGSIMLLAPDGSLVVKASTVPELIGLRRASDAPGVSQWVVEHGESVFVHDFSDEMRWGEREQTYTHGSCLSVPIAEAGKVLGVLNVSEKQGGAEFFESDEAQLHDFLSRIALIIQHAGARDRLEQQAQALSEHNVRLVALLRSQQMLTRLLVHELKGPMGAIIGNLELLSMDAEVPDGGAEETESGLLQASLASCYTIVRMVSDLLDVAGDASQPMLPCPESVVLPDFMADETEAFSMMVHANDAEVRWSLQEDLPLVAQLDRTLVARALGSLVANGAEHAPSGSWVEIRVELDAAKHLCFVVTDAGPLVPEEERDGLFDVSVDERSLRSRGYHGIGLAFCRLVAEAHGGKVMVEEGAEGRNQFRFQLSQAALDASAMPS